MYLPGEPRTRQVGSCNPLSTSMLLSIPSGPYCCNPRCRINSGELNPLLPNIERRSPHCAYQLTSTGLAVKGQKIIVAKEAPYFSRQGPNKPQGPESVFAGAACKRKRESKLASSDNSKYASVRGIPER